jgi:UDP-N-acetylmuramate--alanine ligase
MIWISDKNILESLENYSGVWRRMEKIGTTENWNILISDYGHHPTEIQVTLKALRDSYPDNSILCVFQPHQYSRTIELIEWFKDSFDAANTLIVPNIYESRDSEANKLSMNTDKFLRSVNHENWYNWNWLENTVKLIQDFDKKESLVKIILLLWAWDVDSLRDKIKTS